MQDFFRTAGADFTDTFKGAWIFPLLILCIIWILWQEKDRMKRLLTGILPLVFLFLYWCPLTGKLFMKILGENVYWRILWLILPAVTIPYAGCLLLGKVKGILRYGVFLAGLAVLALCGKKVLSEEWFAPSTNVYKLPQNVVAVCDLLPENIHALVSNRLMPYIRQYDPSITLEFGRNAMIYNGMEEPKDDSQILYLEAQKQEIDLEILAPLAKQRGCTFLIFSANRTYIGDWEAYGYKKYADTDEFCIFVDEDYQTGEDTRKWED
ncbi:MAG TPA: hypothetical protein DD414_01345 [Lachnospiraceae bacterium]|nr:hypothetical protein [Lachnospiraceae bacterium]